jgi:membrane-associated protease RseP (regulator of RpoE activity)
MAGWVGLLITGLNMLPVSQLDGGHVIYALFRRRAHWVARGFILFALAYIVLFDKMIWAPMAIIVVLIGTDHPPTADDQVRLGGFRQLLGYLSLLIPLLCFPIDGVIPIDF